MKLILFQIIYLAVSVIVSLHDAKRINFSANGDQDKRKSNDNNNGKKTNGSNFIQQKSLKK